MNLRRIERRVASGRGAAAACTTGSIYVTIENATDAAQQRPVSMVCPVRTRPRRAAPQQFFPVRARFPSPNYIVQKRALPPGVEKTACFLVEQLRDLCRNNGPTCQGVASSRKFCKTQVSTPFNRKRRSAEFPPAQFNLSFSCKLRLARDQFEMST